MDQALFLLLYLFAGDPVEIVDPAFYFKSIKQPYDTASLVKLFGKDVRDNSDLAKRLKELGDEDRKVRKNAKKRLLEIGNIALVELGKLAKSDDPELSESAKSIIKKINERAALKSAELSKFLAIKQLSLSKDDAAKEFLKKLTQHGDPLIKRLAEKAMIGLVIGLVKMMRLRP